MDEEDDLGKQVTEAILSSKPVQIQAVSLPGDSNSGPHVQLFALCADGSIWVQYHSSGYSNVPTDGLWRLVQPPDGWDYGKDSRSAWAIPPSLQRVDR